MRRSRELYISDCLDMWLSRLRRQHLQKVKGRVKKDMKIHHVNLGNRTSRNQNYSYADFSLVLEVL